MTKHYRFFFFFLPHFAVDFLGGNLFKTGGNKFTNLEFLSGNRILWNNILKRLPLLAKILRKKNFNYIFPLISKAAIYLKGRSKRILFFKKIIIKSPFLGGEKKVKEIVL